MKFNEIPPRIVRKFAAGHTPDEDSSVLEMEAYCAWMRNTNPAEPGKDEVNDVPQAVMDWTPREATAEEMIANEIASMETHIAQLEALRDSLPRTLSRDAELAMRDMIWCYSNTHRHRF